MLSDKYIYLDDKSLDILLVKLIFAYQDYDYCEALLLVILTTEMAEA